MRQVLSKKLSGAVALLALAAVVANAASGPSFMSIGDFGCMPVGGWRAQEELTVSAKFTSFAQQVKPEFILNPGDNFYWCGVHNKTSSLWDSTFENVFADQSLMVNWYSALGNHDYGLPGSVEAQIEYESPNKNRWVLPNRYYYKRVSVGGGAANVSLIVLDSSPCQSMYRSTDPSGWDPCGSSLPNDCPGCTFHANVVAQSCATQLAWLKTTLASIPEGDWRIAMIHAPASDIDVEDLITPLQEANFDLVVNGHVHLLAHYTVDGVGTYITSGAGCMVHVGDRGGATPAAVERDQNVSLGASSCTSYSTWHTCEIVFQRTVPGFAVHTFSEDLMSLTTTLIDDQGNTLHSTTTKKNSNSTGPTASPGAPTPAPTHKNQCCYYSDSSCQAGQTCCDTEGKSYTQYTCDDTQWGDKHNCIWNFRESKCIVG